MDKISTGIKGFDDIMGGLYPGDNVVWQVEDINNYKHVVDAFVRKSIKDGKNVNYIHFRKVNSIIDDLSKVNLFELDLAKGFGIVCVILGHMDKILINRFVFSFHMPLFL